MGMRRTVDYYNKMSRIEGLEIELIKKNFMRGAAEGMDFTLEISEGGRPYWVIMTIENIKASAGWPSHATDNNIRAALISTYNEAFEIAKVNAEERQEFLKRRKEVYNLLNIIYHYDIDGYWDILDALEVPQVHNKRKDAATWITEECYDEFRNLGSILGAC